MRRLGRLAVGVLIFLIVLPGLDLSYTAGTVYLLVVTPFVGAAIYGAFFATAGLRSFSSMAASSPRHSFTAAATRVSCPVVC